MKLKILIAIIFMAAGSIFIPSPASAFNADTDCKKGTMYYNYHHTDDKAGLTAPKPKAEISTLADCNLPGSSTDFKLMDTAATIINVIVGVTGIIAVVVIVIGGILYVTSTGDATKAKRAQHTILYGIVGLIIALLAFAIVNFVLGSVF